MSNEAEIYKERWQREKKARAAAESLAEEKTAELFKSSQQLEQLLLGSVKVLTDVLAMARPEVFAKASKVQGWARRMLPKLEIERPWELELAALLYPLGVLSLPEELGSKYTLGHLLTDDERALVAQSSQEAHDLLCNLPRMESIARTVLYCRKGFDGSGFPNDEVKGENIPEAARVLNILIDLADDSTGTEKKRDFKGLLARKEIYDINFLKTAFQVLYRKEGEAIGSGQRMVVATGLLRTGDLVNRDVMDKEGHLVLAAGAALSEVTIRRLRVLRQEGALVSEIEILRE